MVYKIHLLYLLRPRDYYLFYILRQHILRSEQVFDRLRESNLKIKSDKSEFLRTEIKYLGHVISPEGVGPNPDKMNTVKNYPIPTNQKEIRSFLGVVRICIPYFAKVAKLINN